MLESYYNRGAPTEQFIIPSQFITVDSALAQCQHLSLYSNQEFEFGRPPFHSFIQLASNKALEWPYYSIAVSNIRPVGRLNATGEVKEGDEMKDEPGG